MTINPEQMMAAAIPVIEQHYDWRNCVLYALGLGVGLDPMDEADLPFVDETRLKVEPTMANVLGYPGFWQRELPLGLDWVKTVHGEQSMRIHKPLPAQAAVRGVSRVVDLVDKGEGRGALIFVEREIRDMASGALLATVAQTVFCRGDGGFGGVNKPQPAPHAIPERAADASIDLPTSPQSALVYRLSGDFNPLHANPETARQAGFARPILHGLATFGVAGHGLVKRWCDGDPTALRAMGGRFSSPVFPGETVRVEIWRESAGRAAFRASVPARGVVVINNGLLELAV
ncbi:MAG TPA: MaoC/PaaZ C-terminal domain-containing protein [Pseudorhodoferax sp.]|nr:MaoC/PaaZ C-terminal domain-containing protein [Pseudorhodoferax sp.]